MKKIRVSQAVCFKSKSEKANSLSERILPNYARVEWKVFQTKGTCLGIRRILIQEETDAWKNKVSKSFGFRGHSLKKSRIGTFMKKILKTTDIFCFLIFFSYTANISKDNLKFSNSVNKIFVKIFFFISFW